MASSGERSATERAHPGQFLHAGRFWVCARVTADATFMLLLLITCIAGAGDPLAFDGRQGGDPRRQADRFEDLNMRAAPFGSGAKTMGEDQPALSRIS